MRHGSDCITIIQQSYNHLEVMSNGNVSQWPSVPRNTLPATVPSPLHLHPASAQQRAASRARQDSTSQHLCFISAQPRCRANIEMYVSMLEIWSGSIYQDNTSIYSTLDIYLVMGMIDRYLSMGIYNFRHTFLYYFDRESMRYCEHES